tara:strand:+ start:288 stop:869 length:582 start_codon:yes stop_codon:yes gene_type:complete
MSFHTFLSSEPQLPDEKLEMLIDMIIAAMRILLKKENEILSDRSKFVRWTENFFKRLGYFSLQETYDAMPKYVLRAEYVLGGRNEEKLNSEKYNTEPSRKLFKEISAYYNIKWKRINKRLYRNRNSQSGQQKILADAFLNTSNGMVATMIYTQIIENKEFEHYLMEDDDDNGGCLDGCLDGCTTMLYDDANKF